MRGGKKGGIETGGGGTDKGSRESPVREGQVRIPEKDTSGRVKEGRGT